MFERDVTRRVMMKGALKAGAYSAPAILSVTTAQGVAAASVPPRGVVTYLSSGITQGSGFSPNTPYLLVLFHPFETAWRQLSPILTDASGNFTLNGSPDRVGHVPAPATVNGGNIFVLLADTFGGTIPAGAAAPASTAAPTRNP